MVSKLKEKERIFLAGCIKSLIEADNRMEEAEFTDLEDIIKRLNFDDFDKSLETFESKVKDSETFWQMAGEIDNTETQELVLQILDELSLQDGIPGYEERKIIDDLSKFWDS